MAILNFEAIGRCKVLRERIDTLRTQRGTCVHKLKEEASRLAQGYCFPPPEVEEFDIDFAHSLINDIVAVDRSLMQAIYEFNCWSLDAGEQPIKLNLPAREAKPVTPNAIS
ncbi:hypothetical protein FE392_04955 [Xenorhabdus sp. 12]|uniref:Uncharacterized protein n=1 Tax=Xenorhabdus santafensis TaxID=2582833 RepID=A0ABU4S6L8_9GAMM|nr:hypothetical protein [Xenorhabdus sp. 12]MDX7986686.1 hypothetical protein [Xenorhabdus sp. 12]